VLRWRVPQFAAILAAFTLPLALAACGGGAIVPAPVGGRQPPLARTTPRAPISVAPVLPPGTGKVALLLPLSGPNAPLGKAMLQAAQLALFTTTNQQLTLIPRDTAGTPAGSAAAAHSAIDNKAQLILGPLLAGDVAAVGPIADAAHLNVIAFSTATQLAGGNVFLMGFLPQQEIEREVAFARERGLRRFAALVPDTPYGRLTAAALRKAVGDSGGTVVRIESFASGGGDLSAAIGRLLQTGSGDAPATPTPDAAPGAPAPAAPGAPTPATPATPSAPAKPATIDFDALLLPEGGAQLKEIAQQLQAAGVAAGKVRLLGSGLWDDAAVANDPALYGGWFAASPPEARREFVSRFAQTYGKNPPRLASLAFDAAALSAVLADEGGTKPFSRDAIRNPRGFTGVDGLFRFTPAGLVQRGLAVLAVGPQGATVVSPAPTSFQDLAY
jgi:ABC-type branched-subunit amino acid transport system substrate-binding protein